MSKRTPLAAVHERAGATFTDFAGYDMPVRYTSDLAEHHAVRDAAGLFDLSHMAEIEVRGTGAAAFVDYALSNQLSALEDGQAKYSLLLAEDGCVIDDLIVYRLAADHYFIVANAANREVAYRALAERSAGFDAVVTDGSDDWALIAVQGPRALEIMLAAATIQPASSLTDLRYYRVLDAHAAGAAGYIARTGYTGEDGFEIFVPADRAEALWDELVATGAPFGLALCGLACRDTLRLEAGMPLYGHELNLHVTPAQAGLGRVADMTKEAFVGKEGLERNPDGSGRVLVGLAAEGKRAPRQDYPVLDASGSTQIGVITSGALSPTLGYPIAMAYVDAEFAEIDTALLVDVRGSHLAVTVTKRPFYQRKKDTP